MNFIKTVKNFLFENTSTKQTIVKNTFWLLLAEFVNKGSVFFITLYIAAKLGPEQFGVMSFVTSFVGFFIIFSDFGLTTLMVRDVSKNQSLLPDYLLNLSVIKLGLGIITLLVVMLVSSLFSKIGIYGELIIIYLIYAIVSNFSEFLRSFFRPGEQMQHEAFLKIIQGAIFVSIVGGVLYYSSSLRDIFLAYVFCAIVGIITTGIYLSLHSGKIIITARLSKPLLKSGLTIGYIFLLNSFFFQVYNISDQVMLGLYGLELELGKYATAYQFFALLTLGFTILISVANPQLIRILPSKSNFISKYQKIRNTIIGLLIGIITLGLLCSEYIYKTFFPVEYYSAYISLQILLFGLFFSVLNIFLGTILQNMGKEKLCLLGVAIGGFLNVGLNFYFIQYGSIGVAFTTFLTNIVVLILLLNFFRYAQKNYWKTH